MTNPQAPDPLRRRPHGLEFDDLKDLSDYLEGIEGDGGPSLAYFRYDSKGFAHRVDPAVGPKKTSKASTATCVAYLRAAGKLTGEGWDEKTRYALRAMMIDGEWESARLCPDNPFTSAFLLEAIQALGGRENLETDRETKVDEKIQMLNAALVEQGGLSIALYPATAFLTYKVVRVLEQWGMLTADAVGAVSRWNWPHLYEESMLIASDSPDADFFELAYSVLTASRTTFLDRMTPRERRLLHHAVEQFFAGQRNDGTWPRSRPLFLYPDIGYAYCYDYELLVQLLSERQLRPFVLPHLGALRKAAWTLDARRVPLEHTTERAHGWSSEHHGKKFEAESWPTASVFHFCFELGRLVSDAVRREAFEYVGATYEEPTPEPPADTPLGDLMDSDVEYKGNKHPFKALLINEFLDPLRQERNLVRDGRSFGSDTKVSMIMYGPPGTSKTRIARRIARALGWPLLVLDSSHLTRRGLDNVHAETDAVFRRLLSCDQVVVLLDEFDELVRERDAAGEIQSRFLTTAMLPKIADLHERRRLVYIVATNHVEQFDAAISRPGRFDVIVPVMPPTSSAKFDEWPALERAQSVLSEATPPYEVEPLVEDLTHAEAKELAGILGPIEGDVDALRSALTAAGAGAILRRRVSDAGSGSPESEDGAKQPKPNDTWKVRIQNQESEIRGLGL